MTTPLLSMLSDVGTTIRVDTMTGRMAPARVGPV